MDLSQRVTDASPRRHPLRYLAWSGVDDDADAGSPPHGTAVLVHGSFYLATCRQCEWTGSARRARHTALRDAVRHSVACPGTVELDADLERIR